MIANKLILLIIVLVISACGDPPPEAVVTEPAAETTDKRNTQSKQQIQKPAVKRPQPRSQKKILPDYESLDLSVEGLLETAPPDQVDGRPMGRQETWLRKTNTDGISFAGNVMKDPNSKEILDSFDGVEVTIKIPLQ